MAPGVGDCSPGSLLSGRYQIKRLIGGGSGTAVFEAIDLQLDRPVAVKLALETASNRLAARARFEDEMRATARLSHPNIVSVFDVIRDDEHSYAVMELVTGRPLQEYIEQQAPFETSDVLLVLQQICDGLESAHDKGIVHGGLSARNVLITSQGRIKITDFGVRPKDTIAAAPKLPPEPPPYLSPEQIRGDAAGNRSDVYSAGVMAYEMLTGRLPLRPRPPSGARRPSLGITPTPPSSYVQALSPAVDVAVLKALNYDAQQRYSSATEFAAAFAAAIDPTALRQRAPAVKPKASPVQVELRPYVGEPTVMLPVTRARSRSTYWLGGLVGMLGITFVISAFLAGTHFLRTTPLAAAPDFNDFAPHTSDRPSAEPILLAAPSSTPSPVVPTPVLTSTPEPTDTPTEVPTEIRTPKPTATPAPQPSPTVKPVLVGVPWVIGLTESQAQNLIRAAGLSTANPNYQTYTVQPPGHVLSQMPSPGSLVPRGTTVYIAVRR